jgi:hypothetical protein
LLQQITVGFSDNFYAKQQTVSTSYLNLLHTKDNPAANSALKQRLDALAKEAAEKEKAKGGKKGAEEDEYVQKTQEELEQRELEQLEEAELAKERRVYSSVARPVEGKGGKGEFDFPSGTDYEYYDFARNAVVVSGISWMQCKK